MDAIWSGCRAISRWVTRWAVEDIVVFLNCTRLEHNRQGNYVNVWIRNTENILVRFYYLPFSLQILPPRFPGADGDQ